ncbi:MAG: redoxin family protein [Pirellulaceae bacterium]
MRRVSFLLLVFIITIGSRSFDVLAAQESAADDKQSKTEDVGADAEDSQQEKKKEVARTPAQNIKELIDQKKFDKAAETLDKALADGGDAASLQPFRTSIGAGLLRLRKYNEAFEQGEKLLLYRLEQTDNSSRRSAIMVSLNTVNLYGRVAKKTDRVDELIDLTIETLSEATKGDANEYLSVMSSLLPIKASRIATTRDYDAVREFLNQHLSKFDELKIGAESEVSLLIAKSKLMIAAAGYPNGPDDALESLDTFMASALESHPDSIPMLSAFAEVQVMQIGRTYRSKPKQAQEKIESLRELIESKGKDNSALKSRLSQLKSYESRIEAAIKLLEMVGQPAPKLDVETWVNQGDTTLESLKGKVLLVDFWSVWCGPCIMTFPHLSEWREEFHDKGFEIVGVTRYYNYKWDADAERAVRSKEDVSPEDEQKMLESFLAHHKLKHPTLITPKGSTMQKDFGVTGIPHVAVIDREGIVQLVKVGAGDSNTKEIHAKLVELLAE